MTPDDRPDALGQRLAALSPRGRAALRTILQERAAEHRGAGRPANGTRAPELRRRPPGTRAPLSFAQERLWWLAQFIPDNAAYNETNSVRLRFPLDLDVLRRALDEIVRRHEVLRMSVEVVDDRPWQRIGEPASLDLPVVDLRRLRPDEREAEARSLAAEQSRRPFDLTAGPLLRAAVFQLEDADFLFVLTMHHLVCDGWSMGVFSVELVTHYWSFVAGRPSPLPELPVQYGDYAVWQHERLTPEVLERQVEYWEGKLRGLATLEVPTDRPRPASFTFNGARCPVEVGGDLLRSLEKLAEREGVTLHMVLLAAFAVLLHRYTEQDDVVVGTPSAGRRRRELEPLIGFFVNTLVMRVRVADGATFRDVLGEVRRTAAEAFAHDEAPFDQVVERLRPPRDPSRNPLYQVQFQLFRAPAGPAGLRTDVLVAFAPVDSGISKVDLSLELIWSEQAARGHLEFNSDLFDRGRIERMVQHWLRLLEGAVADPGAKVAQLPMLTAAERDRLLVGWNRAAAPFPRDRTIPQLFADAAARSGDEVAVHFGGRAMTYREVADLAGGVAAELAARGVRRGDRVALHLDRSLVLPAAMLGILAAGAAYVPLDPAHPPPRLTHLLTDSGAGVVVTGSGRPDALGDFDGAVLALDEVSPGDGTAARDLVPGAAATDLAYLMYTSGTTGTPKGVAVTHRNILRLVCDVGYVDLGGAPRVLQFAPVSFDASTFEVWGPLLNGGSIAVHPPGVPSLEELGAFIRDARVDIAFLTTALFSQLVDRRAADLRGVRQLLTGGEELRVAVAHAAWRALPRSALINCYGPTECTTYASTYRIGRPETLPDAVPIGRPIDNTTAYVVDRNLEPMPIGVPGELCLGGDGVASGYWQRPELTDARFVANPFGEGRLYRTGDVASWREDGELLFLGRRDRQVKVRGFRVELGEVEAAIAAHPGVRAAVAVAPGGEERHLEAFYEPSGEDAPPPAALGEYLRARVPAHMVPSRLEAVDRLPLTANGKVDVAALGRAGPGERTPADGYVAPRTAVERRLAELWSELLEVDRVGVRDDFFALGGHSLIATRLLSRVRSAFGVEVTMRSFFDAPTVEALAHRVQ